MRSGRLRHRVTIQRREITRNAFGEGVDGWGNFAVVWASVEPLQGREFFDAQHVTAEVTLRVRMRYRTDITPEMRLTHRGKILVIQAVLNPEERNRELELLCSEVT